MCIDYRKLNEMTVTDIYPLPKIDEILEILKDAEIFTKFGLKLANNFRIKMGDKYKTAFRSRYGHYQFNVMPFGLKNAPAVFQSFINKVLGELLYKKVIV